MKISLLGSGDLTKVERFTEFSEKELKKLIEDLAKLIAEKGHEIVIIPNRGIPLEIAEAFKKAGGKKIWGIIPTKDKDYGLGHIEEFLSIINNKIEVDSWYDADGKIAASGDVCIVIGMSPGVMRALTALKFHLKYKNCKTKVIIFENTISSHLAREIEEEIPIRYINSIKELEEFI